MQEWTFRAASLRVHEAWDSEGTETQIIISDLANGIYHYEIEFANMNKKFGKINIQKIENHEILSDNSLYFFIF